MTSARWAAATAKTVTLTVALAAVGLLLLVGAALPWPGQGLLTAPLSLPPWLVWLLLGCLFAVAELSLIHVEFRREAYSFSITGIPLVIGLALVSPLIVVAARLVGTAVAFAVQRPTPIKVAYNAAAYVFEVALAAAALHLLLVPGPTLTWRAALAFFVVAAVAEAVMGLLVLQVIAWHMTGSDAILGLTQILGVLRPGVLFSVTSTTVALPTVMLIQSGTLGSGLVVLLGCGGGLLYAQYVRLRAKHASLAVIHEVIDAGRGATSVSGLADRTLHRFRDLLHAGRAELLLVEGAGYQLLSVDEGSDGVRQAQLPALDWLLSSVQESHEPLLLARNCRESTYRSWLDRREVADAIVVPVGSGHSGLLLILDRLGDTASFTDDDVRLLTTLAGHLDVAITSAQLLQRLSHDATHDLLTGVANRAQLRTELQSVVADPLQAARSALVMLDLDRFKEVNDALGHPVGDKLLQSIAVTLREIIPTGAVLARLGGDEFAVLLTDSDDPLEGASILARDLADTLSRPIALEGALVSSQCSVGITEIAPHTDVDELLRRADAAMYAAKRDQSGPRVHTAELDRGRAERLALLADLQVGLQRDELVMRYQPQLDLRTGRIISVEALVRWQHPRLGLLAPDTFIPLAETSGMIDRLTAVVLAQSLADCHAWTEAGYDITVAVNLAARNVNQSTLPQEVGAALAVQGLTADRLILEITESSVMDNLAQTVPTLRRLRDIGVRLSLDDFGTGYSSLSYLQRLPVAELKIDRSFIAPLSNAADGSRGVALVKGIVRLATSLGLSVVAEGVESAEGLDRVAALGCQVAQGYHIARPLTFDALLTFLGAAQHAPLRLVAGD